MAVIIIDGPEKAGKTTTIKALKVALEKLGREVQIRKWTAANSIPDDRVYAGPLAHDTEQTKVITLWDRGWPSQYVYGQLLKRTDRMVNDPWLGAWLHDRAVQANGLRVMMLGPSITKLQSLRDSSDLKVNPKDEVKLFERYADHYGWLILVGYQHTDADLKSNIKKILAEYKKNAPTPLEPLPPHWAGPQNADVVFIGQEKGEHSIKGGWLPFTNKMTMEFARTFGDKAIQYGWTNAHNCPPVYLRNRKVLVACGLTAQLWVQNYVIDKENKKQIVLNIPHPSYLYRFKNERTQRALRHALSDLQEVLHYKGDN